MLLIPANPTRNPLGPTRRSLVTMRSVRLKNGRRSAFGASNCGTYTPVESACAPTTSVNGRPVDARVARPAAHPDRHSFWSTAIAVLVTSNAAGASTPVFGSSRRDDETLHVN